MAQRASEPQIIAESIDNLIPIVRRKLLADGEIDSMDHAILGELEACSNRSLRHAEILDLTSSLMQVGFNKRNNRRIRDIAPLAAIPPSAA